jgi:hypothetical protein
MRLLGKNARGEIGKRIDTLAYQMRAMVRRRLLTVVVPLSEEPRRELDGQGLTQSDTSALRRDTCLNRGKRFFRASNAVGGGAIGVSGHNRSFHWRAVNLPTAS